jgi:Lipopolysaccharide kinase (Kdo/WaaP) family
MTGAPHVVWRAQGWRGWVDPTAGLDPLRCVADAGEAAGRTSRHARTVRLATPAGPVFVKTYAAPGGWRATRAFRMGEALDRTGFQAPAVVAAAQRRRAGFLITREVGGDDLLAVLARPMPLAAKRAFLRTLGEEVGRLHAAGFVHGDLVPPNVRLDAAGRFVFLDNDRTRRSRLLVLLVARRNLVQLGRFVVPGLTLTDRARVLAGYGAVRALSRRSRQRLARWVVRKTVARRCAIDRIAPANALRAGFRELMRSGGPFDPAAHPGGAQ